MRKKNRKTMSGTQKKKLELEITKTQISHTITYYMYPLTLD